MKLTIRNKLIIGFAVILALVLVLGIVSYRTIRAINVTNEHVVEELYTDMALDEALGAKYKWINGIESQVFFDRTFEGELNPDKCEIGRWLANLKNEHSEVMKLGADMGRIHDKMHKTAITVLDTYKKGNKEEAKRIFTKELEPLDIELEDTGERLSATSMTEVDKNIKIQKSLEKSSTVLIFVMLLLILACGVLTAYIIINAITKPINLLIKTTNQIVQTGDLDQEIAFKAEDEMGALANSFRSTMDWMKDMSAIALKMAAGDLDQNVIPKSDKDLFGNAFKNMVTGLKNTVISILETAESVSSSSQQLSATAQAMNATIEEAASTVQQIAKGAEIQAQKVEESTKVIEGMSLSINSVAENSAKASSASDQSVSSAQSGGKAAKDAVEKMGAINNSVESSSVVVKQLGERSQEIDDIIKVITDIADQTNLLALNAAIEAARAGESGRGFAVVAEEVRKLAEGSAKAADEISKLIRTIKQETGSVVKSMDEVSKDVGSGRDVIKSVDTVLSEIIENAQDASAMVRQIKEATEEQTVGAKQIVKSVSDIASTSEETAAATEEASASTEEMTSSMEELSASAEELADMAMGLRSLVGRFKVGENIDFHKPNLKKGFKTKAESKEKVQEA
ncbi:MAG: methyl-accepting chemotaxis protein [Armatimonadota bacterium]